MRKSHVIGFAVASLLLSGSIAQAQATAPQPRRELGAPGARFEGGRRRHGALGGIKLSDAEQARVKEIHSKYNTEAKSLRERERAEIRTALSAEHQTQFDANAKQLQERRAERRKNGKGNRAGKAGNRGTRRGVSQS